MMHSVEDQTHVRPMSEPAPAQGQMSPLNLLWGHRWLAMLGAAVGVSAGWFYYQKQPPVYSSKTQIQIVEPYARNLPIQGMDGVANAARGLGGRLVRLGGLHSFFLPAPRWAVGRSSPWSQCSVGSTTIGCFL